MYNALKREDPELICAMLTQIVLENQLVIETSVTNSIISPKDFNFNLVPSQS